MILLVGDWANGKEVVVVVGAKKARGPSTPSSSVDSVMGIEKTNNKSTYREHGGLLTMDDYYCQSETDYCDINKQGRRTAYCDYIPDKAPARGLCSLP